MKVPPIGTVNMSTLPILLNLSRSNLYQVTIENQWLTTDKTTPFADFLSNGTQYGSINFSSDFGTQLGLLCSEASLPTSSYATAEVKDNYMGVSQEFAHSRINTDVDFTFYIDRQYKVLGFFEAWMDYISGGAGGYSPQQQASGDPNTSGYYRRFNYPKYYKNSGVFIKKFERDFATSNATNISFQLINAFPKSVTSIPVAYGDAEVMKVTVTMNYDRYIMRREYGAVLATPGALSTPNGILNQYASLFGQGYQYDPTSPSGFVDANGNPIILT